MSDHWSEHREGGGRFAIWLIRTIGLTFGRACARLLLYPITLYFFLRRAAERRASYFYLERVLGKPATAWMVMRHIHSFASTILDRIYLLTENLRRFDINVFGLDELHAQMRPDRGMLLLGAHVGSFEVLRVMTLQRPDVTVRVVLNTRQTPAMTELLHALNPAIANNVIDASRPGHEVVFALHDAMQAGDLATLLGDRARPNEATVEVDFLGSPANSSLTVSIGAVQLGTVPVRQQVFDHVYLALAASDGDDLPPQRRDLPIPHRGVDDPAGHPELVGTDDDGLPHPGSTLAQGQPEGIRMG